MLWARCNSDKNLLSVPALQIFLRGHDCHSRNPEASRHLRLEHTAVLSNKVAKLGRSSTQLVNLVKGIKKTTYYTVIYAQAEAGPTFRRWERCNFLGSQPLRIPHYCVWAGCSMDYQSELATQNRSRNLFNKSIFRSRIVRWQWPSLNKAVNLIRLYRTCQTCLPHPTVFHMHLAIPVFFGRNHACK